MRRASRAKRRASLTQGSVVYVPVKATAGGTLRPVAGDGAPPVAATTDHIYAESIRRPKHPKPERRPPGPWAELWGASTTHAATTLDTGTIDPGLCHRRRNNSELDRRGHAAPRSSSAARHRRRRAAVSHVTSLRALR